MPKKKKEEAVIKEKKEEEKPKKISQEDFEKKVIELAEKGLTSEKIGENLRQQGIHPKEFSKKISEILMEKKKYIIPELKNIEEKLEKLEAHAKKNKLDQKAKRERDRIYSQLRKIKKYFKVAIK
ncbi:MAG TPA: hypothetical protein VJ438_01035 [Candidatus Nanoarchaeia archaeon]|nr:hypothetical protein [Candidatus Nanoarchaeia archaeon]